ncbi:MAG: hypothetical protein K6C12_06015 [Oscillospiraceae bacterium]|nr:hypothetical protein [Oscillospiraceae bacterium]
MILEYELMDLFQKLMVLNSRSHTVYIQPDNPTPLTDTQAIVLDYILQETRTRDVYAKDLEVYFGIKASSVNSIVNYLEREAFVSREILPEDNRLKRLVPTQRAREIEAWLLETIHYSIVDVFAGFTEEEMQDLKSLMEKMRVNLLSMACSGKPHYARDPKKAYTAARG